MVSAFRVLIPILSFAAFVTATPYKSHAENGDDIEQSGDDFESELSESQRHSTQSPFIKVSAVDEEDLKTGDDAQAIIELFSNQQRKHDEPEPQPEPESNQLRMQQAATKSIPSTVASATGPTPTKSKQSHLNDDVNDFIELIPKAEIKAKLEEYYRNDMDVQHIFEYVHGKEFHELRRNLLELADVKELLHHLSRNGLNVKGVVRRVDNRLGISKIRPNSLMHAAMQSFATNTTIGGLNSLIEDVLALLPQDEIFLMFFEKLDNSPRFATFIQSTADPDFHRRYNSLWKSKELHSAAAQLKKHKIDMAKIIQILRGYFIFGTF